MRILFICNEYPPAKHGGIGVFVKNIAERLTQDFEVECIVVGLYSNIDADSTEVVSGVTVIRKKERIIFLSRYLNIIQNLWNRFYLSFYIKYSMEFKSVDIVESYDWTGPLLFNIKPFLITRLHGSNSANSIYEGIPKSNYLFFFEKRNIKLSDAIISVSEHMLDCTHKTFGVRDKIEQVIHNPVNLDLFKVDPTTNRNNKSLLFVGKFHERKGVFELFNILKYLLVLDPEYIFTFVGNHTDENREQLLSIINESNRKCISFVNAVPQNHLPVLYNSSTLMIMPSRAEAFGLTAIEAMACGCVVAMSNRATGPELINDGYDGLLIDSFNYKDSAIKIHNLLVNSLLLKRMSKNAFEKVQSIFSNKIIIEKNYNFYKSVISNEY